MVLFAFISTFVSRKLTIPRGGLTATYACLLLLSLTSCDDFLTIDPQDDLSRAELLGTVAGADAAVVGLYHRLGDVSYYRFRFGLLADVPGNLAPTQDGQSISIADLNGNRLGFTKIYSLDLDPLLEFTGLEDFYQDAYEILFQATDVADALTTITEGPQEALISLEAEARALRALVHFDLVRTFAQAPGFSPGVDHPGIVLINAVPDVLAEPARASVGEVYAQIRTDLEFATANLDPAFSRRSAAPHWLTPAVVNGLLARIAAYQQDWATCAESATRSIAQSTVELTPTSEYLTEWDDDRLTETLWELDLQRIIEDGEDLDPESHARIVGFNEEEPFLQISSGLNDLYASGDIRRQLIIRTPQGDRLSRKWPWAINTIRNPPLLRLSEVYLLRAEARAELGDLSGAAEDYLRIARRANPSVAPPPGDQAGLRELIRQERRRELALEGHHFFDLSRWGTALERTDCADFITDCTVPYPDFRFAFPIPLDATFRNPSLTQNPGY